jgi:hypothetical protein
MAGMLSTTSSSSSSTTMSSTTSQQPLYLKYPISSQWEFKLNNGETVKGEIYCTDPVADLVIIQDTTNNYKNDIRMISVTSISDETQTESKESDIEEDAAQKAAAAAAAATNKVDIVHSKKVLDEREKRAIRLAQESLKHLNPKVRYNLLVRRVMSLLFVLLGSDSIQFNLI